MRHSDTIIRVLEANPYDIEALEGWLEEMAAQGNSFYIFLTQDPDAPELYTDAMSYSLAMKHILRSAWLYTVCFLACAAPLDRTDRGLLEVRSESFKSQAAGNGSLAF